MKAVILAAGVGSRLGRPFPKSLSLLPDGERILGRQIRIFQQFGINEIFVVVGFKKELIMEEFPQVYYKYKDKVSKIEIPDEIITVSNNTIKSEALSALMTLSFNKNATEKALDKLLKQTPDTTVEVLIREALKIL